MNEIVYRMKDNWLPLMLVLVGSFFIMMGIGGRLTWASFVGGTMTGAGISLLVIRELYLARDRATRRAQARKIPLSELFAPELPPPMKGTVVFCSDCGKRMVRWRKQVGFKAKSGDPMFSERLGCPDWDGMVNPSLGTMSSLMRMSGSGLKPADMRYQPNEIENAMNCGQKVIGDWKPAVEHNHPPTEASVSCLPCIIDMEQAGILDRAEANAAIAKLS